MAESFELFYNLIEASCSTYITLTEPIALLETHKKKSKRELFLLTSFKQISPNVRVIGCVFLRYKQKDEIN